MKPKGSSRRFGWRRRSAPANQASHRVAWLGSTRDPEVDPLLIQFEFNRFAARVVVAYDFDETPVALGLPFRDHNAIERSLLRSLSGQSDS